MNTSSIHSLSGRLPESAAEPGSEESSETTVDVVCGNSGQVCETLYEWTGSEFFAEATSLVLGVPLKIVLIAIIALILNRIARRAISRATARLGTVTAEHGESVVEERSVDRAEERASTIGSLLQSLPTAVIYGVALLMMLETLGIGVVAAVASAGVLGLAIGFGAQSVVEVGVSYAADLDQAIEVLDVATRDSIEDSAWRELIDGDPQVQGVQELGDDAVIIRIIVWVDAGERRRFERHLRQRLKQALDREGIEMPNRQVDVWLRDAAAAA